MASTPGPRALVDGWALRQALAAVSARAGAGVRPEVAQLLKAAHQAGRQELDRRLVHHPGRGREAAHAHARLLDLLVRALFAEVTRALSPPAIALVAVGGYGRGELAPFSDIDLLFLAPARPSAAAEAAITDILHQLWDWGLKVGHATRSAEEMLRAAKADLTVRTSLVEARFLAGDRPAFDAAFARFRREMVAGQQARFVAEKLEERAARHKRMGDSRYLNEPNVKEGKGGLRDLHTLFWIGKFVHQTVRQDDLVKVGLLSAEELRAFCRAEDFFWTVRMQLHQLSGRAEERLTFDVQPELARRLRYADRPGAPGVERFMRHYFLHARTVGALTGVFLAQLEEQFGSRSWVPTIARKPGRLGGFVTRRGRIQAPGDDFFRADPVRLLELFRHAADSALEIDAGTLRLAARDAELIDARVRADPRACAAFLAVLTSPRDPEKILRWMNECGVFGRFMPDFGRVVARPQFDMYHHYTVDEHTIRAIGLLSRVESGARSADYPLASAIAHTIAQRSVLYLAVLLHDIAKGRGGDHSELGSHIARRWCPRFGLSDGETETVAWLVRHHLLMSNTAFKRDLSDPETVERFARAVGSAERLRLLTLLTTIDISAVGPGIWNPWKARLIEQLHELAEERLRPGYRAHGRAEAVARRQAALATAMGWDAARLAAHAARFEDSYWLAETPAMLVAHARLLADAGPLGAGAGALVAARAEPDPETGATRVIVTAPDVPGLFARIAGAIALAGASIVDARGHTTRDGQGLDSFAIQDPLGQPFDEPRRLRRVEALIRAAIAGEVDLATQLPARPPARPRAEAFDAAPVVFLSNGLSNRFTVAEVSALDRPALLWALASALTRSGATIRSAHGTTFGERIVDTFYLTDAQGAKIEDADTLERLRTALHEAAAPAVRASRDAPAHAAA